MDVAIELSETGADIVIEGGDLRPDPGLRSAVLTALFCDARANVDELPVGDDPRGWWGSDPGDEWGSKLWLLARQKQTVSVLELARGYARAAMQWALASGIAERVDCVTAYGAAGQLGIDLKLTRGSARRWQGLWDGEEPRQAELAGVVIRLLPG